MPSGTRVGSNTSTSPSCSRSNAKPVTTRRPSSTVSRFSGHGAVGSSVGSSSPASCAREGEDRGCCGESGRELVAQEVGGHRGRVVVADARVAAVGHEVIAPEAHRAVSGNEPERVESVIAERRVARRNRMGHGRHDRGERFGVLFQDRAHLGRIRLTGCGIGATCVVELQKILGGSRAKNAGSEIATMSVVAPSDK